MGRIIKTNNKDNWEIYSTIADGIIAKFETEKDLKNFIAQETVYDGKLKAIEYLMTYPYKWTVNDVRVWDENGTNIIKTYYYWVEEIQNSETYEEYYKKIDDKLKELLKY